MDKEKTTFLAEERVIEIIPKVNEPVLHLISGDIGPLEAGMPTRVPLWLAIQLRRKNACSIVTPEWLSVDELKRFATEESAQETLVQLPTNFFEMAYMLVKEAKEDVLDCDMVKGIINDISDKREAKLRSSSLRFLGQHQVAHARMDGVLDEELSTSTLRAAQAASQLVAQLVAHGQAME